MAQKLNLFTVFDIKANAHSYPHFYPAKGQAVRSLEDAVNDGKSEISRHPEDYRLFHIGTLDDQTGVFSPLEGGPQLVVDAETLKKV